MFEMTPTSSSTITTGTFSSTRTTTSKSEESGPAHHAHHRITDWSFSYFSFKSADGIKIEAKGEQKQVGEEAEKSGTVASGSYSYPSSDGRLITVNWVADEKGYRASTVNTALPKEDSDEEAEDVDEEYEDDEE